MLRLTDVMAGYDSVQILNGVSLEVNRGELVALIGANGAGKSTTLKAISGLLKPTSGRIEYEGNRIDGMSPDAIVRSGVSQVPEGRRLFPGLTVMENITMGGYTVKGKDFANALQRVNNLFPVLVERERQLASTLSGGQQQMLAFSRGLMSMPKLLLLDEPSLGLAPLVVREMFEVIQQLHGMGMSILLVEQNARLALKIAERAYVIESGAIRLEGKGNDLLGNPWVQRTYLGV